MASPASPRIICLVQTKWNDEFIEIVDINVSLAEQEAETGRYPLPGLDAHACSKGYIKRFLTQLNPQYVDTRANSVDKLLRRRAE
jgi:hypothetical protein